MLPHSLDAERSTLGAVLVNNDHLDTVADVLTTKSFFRDAHRKIFEAMAALSERKVAIDLLTLRQELNTRGILEEVGGPAYMASLADGVPRTTNVGHYAAIVADLALRRDVIYAANAITAEAYEGEHDGPTLIRKADERFLTLDARRSSPFVTPEQAVNDLFIDFDHRLNHPGQLTGLDTGLTTLNEMTGGWQNGDLILIPARTSMGKTGLALNMAARAAETAGPVAFFSLEMSRQQVEYRLLSHLSGVMLFRILRGWLVAAEYTKLSGAFERRRALQLYVDDTSRIGIHDLRRKARRLKAAHGLRQIVVDYIQLVTSGGRRRDQTRSEELGEISHRLKALGQELGVPVVATAQLSRAPDGRADSRPKLSDIRESGALEQDADVVAMIHRKDHKESGECEILLEKQRNGPTGPFIVNFDRDTTTFTDWTKSDVPEEESQPRTNKARKFARGLPYPASEGA